MTYSVLECDGMSAVVLRDETNPRFLEVVCRFFDKARALDYAANANGALQDLAQRIAEKAEVIAPIIGMAIDDHGLPDGQMAVLSVMKRSADEDSLVSKAGKEIAEDAGVPRGSVTTHLNALADKGYIELHENWSGPGYPNVYRVLI